MRDEAGSEDGGGAETDAEAFYVAARVLEEIAKAEDDTEGAVICARVAESVADGDQPTYALEKIATEADGAEKTAGRLRVALDEVRESGNAHVVDSVDDRLVARLRSEFEA
jgi:hypothetical protein